MRHATSLYVLHSDFKLVLYLTLNVWVGVNDLLAEVDEPVHVCVKIILYHLLQHRIYFYTKFVCTFFVVQPIRRADKSIRALMPRP